MKIEEIERINLSQVSDSDLPYRVEIKRIVGKSVFGAGVTLPKAIMAAFRVCNIYRGNSSSELASMLMQSGKICDGIFLCISTLL